MATWPAYAKVALERYQTSVEPQLHRTPFADGHIQQKQIYTDARHTLSLSLPFSDTDKVAFEIWIKDDLNNGSVAFDFTPYGHDTAVKAQIVGGNVNFRLASHKANLPWLANLTLEWWA